MIKPNGDNLRMPVNIFSPSDNLGSARRHLAAFSEGERPQRECNRAEKAALKQALREDDDIQASEDIPDKLLIGKCKKQQDVDGVGYVYEAGFA